MNEEELIEEKLEEVMCENKLLQEEIKDLCKKIKVNEKSRRKMQQSLMKQLQQKEDIINKANKKIEKMFEIGDENKVIDDLLEIQKILDNKGE